MGCTDSAPAALELCLQEANVTELLMRQNDVFSSGDIIGIPFPPVVDGDFLPSDVNVCFFCFFCLFIFLSIYLVTSISSQANNKCCFHSYK